MQQLASSTRFDAEAKAEARQDRHTAFHASVSEDRAALEQRCERLEQMVAELLLKNHELRMRAASPRPEEE